MPERPEVAWGGQRHVVKEEDCGHAGPGKLRARTGEDWEVALGVAWRSWASWSEWFLWSEMTEDAAPSEAASSFPSQHYGR